MRPLASASSSAASSTPELAASELGFTAMVDLEDGLQSTWEWLSGDPELAGERDTGSGVRAPSVTSTPVRS